MTGLVALRLLPVLLIVVAAGFWFADVQEYGPYLARNLLPLAVLVVLCALALWRGGGRWSGAGWRLPLAALGYSIPALGLAVYLHYAYSVNLDGMFGQPPDAGQLFRFLPLYTTFAGAVGAAIGWVVGRNL